MMLPYTLRTINTNVSVKLYFKVGVLRKKIILTEDTFINHPSSITRFTTDLNAKLATAFPQTPNLYNTASNWTMLSGGTETTIAFTAVSTYVFQYTATVGGTPTTFTVTFTNFDMNAGTAQFTESDGAFNVGHKNI